MRGRGPVRQQAGGGVLGVVVQLRPGALTARVKPDLEGRGVRVGGLRLHGQPLAHCTNPPERDTHEAS